MVAWGIECVSGIVVLALTVDITTNGIEPLWYEPAFLRRTWAEQSSWLSLPTYRTYQFILVTACMSILWAIARIGMAYWRSWRGTDKDGRPTLGRQSPVHDTLSVNRWMSVAQLVLLLLLSATCALAWSGVTNVCSISTVMSVFHATAARPFCTKLHVMAIFSSILVLLEFTDLAMRLVL